MTDTGPLVRDSDPQWLKNAARPRADADSAAIGALFGAFLFPPAGIILGHVSCAQANRRGQAPSAPAWWGMVLGYVFTALTVIIIAVVIIAAVKSGPASYAQCVSNAIASGQDPSQVCTP